MPGPDRARPGTAIPHALRAAFTERLGYKAAALFFALVLWVTARAEEPVEEIVPVRIAASYDSMRVLTAPLPPVRALVVGRARELLKLYEDAPVIARAVAPDAPESVQFELRASDVFLPAGVEAQVRDVQPRSITLAFDVRDSRRVPVVSDLHVVVDSSARLSDSRFEPESVTISGRRDLVAQVHLVHTRADTVSVTDSAAYVIPLDLSELSGVRVSPAQVKVSLRALPTDGTVADSAPRPGVVRHDTVRPVLSKKPQ